MKKNFVEMNWKERDLWLITDAEKLRVVKKIEDAKEMLRIIKNIIKDSVEEISIGGCDEKDGIWKTTKLYALWPVYNIDDGVKRYIIQMKGDDSEIEIYEVQKKKRVRKKEGDYR